jgi:hypothetical protein
MKPIGQLPWKGIILAPLAVPLIFSVAVQIFAPGKNPALAFLVIFSLTSMVSYAATILLLLPCLFLVSRLTPLTAGLTGFLGTALGVMVYMPGVWLAYRSSGENPGPPQGSFGEYLWTQPPGWEMYAFPVAGLVTALLYRFLAKPPLRGTVQDETAQHQ